MTVLERSVALRRELPPPYERRAIRQSAGVPAADVADAIGVTRQTVFHWETGAHDPRGANLLRYIEALRVLRSAGHSEDLA